MSASRRSTATAIVIASLATAGLLAASRHMPRRVKKLLTRRNHAGESVTLTEGVAVAAAGPVALAASGRMIEAFTVGATGALGLIDDVVEYELVQRGRHRAQKGLAGHLGAIRRGSLTTGGLKAIGIPVLCMVAASVRPQRRWRYVLLDAGVMAGMANCANLFDLRPGRALKVMLPLAALTLGGRATPDSDPRRTDAAAIVLGTGLTVCPMDIRARGMLGDAGANTLGALTGLGVVDRLGPRGRAVVLAVLVAITIASEKVSFSALIESTPWLARLDALGRPTPPSSNGSQT
ncbi:hypothetical protein [Devriesea agamarum]|uniref:hypothetical protein n=1 Tax=Devriesea agamarum TaxID=472569 RepID=UPI00071CCFEC|nr:hypothetical protein [Devriesea agamarum]